MRHFLSEKEKQWLLQMGGHTSTDYPRDRTVPQLFEQVAVEHGNKIALTSQEGSVTYEELNSKANQLAHHLKKIGVQKGENIGLSYQRSNNMIVAILGILKAGAVYVPIDSNYPLERKRFMVEDAGISVLVTQQELQHEFSSDLHLVCLDSECELLKQYPSNNLNIKAFPLDIAYIYYTSGSTGKPKGAKIPHRGIVRLVRNTNLMSVNVEDRFLQLQNISFDGSTFEIWGALLNGASLDIYPYKKIALDQLAAHLVQQKITIIFLTTRLFNLMVEEQLESLKGLRILCTGGEAMSAHHARVAFQALQSCQLLNGYGPTENTTFTTFYAIQDLKSIAKEVPIGKPISNTTVYILDDNVQLVPVGTPGELYTGGDGLALGYLNQEELTRTKFIPNPFGEGYLYRTGDRAYFQEDGSIIFLGRVDDQVKIRGYRIEFGEVEEGFRSHPDVADCTAFAKKDAQGRLQLLAYLMPKVDKTLNSETLRDYYASKLPEYMIPAHIVCVSKFPMTQHGKIDRDALPPVQVLGNDVETLPFNTEVEKDIASYWSDILGWKNVGPQDHFFHLGGDSIGAMKMASELRKRLYVDIPINTVFQYPTLSEFARHIEQNGSYTREPIHPRVQQDLLPLSLNQEALWIEDRLASESLDYTITYAFHLKGELNRSQLEVALERIVQRHEILRTMFGDGQQMIDNSPPKLLQWVITSGLDEAAALLHEKTLMPFNLQKETPIRFFVFQVNEKEHLALLYLHHILADGHAIQLFLKELAFNYSSQDKMAPAHLQYGDYANWQRSFLKTDFAKKQIDYWTDHLKDAPELLELPWDMPRPMQFSRKGSSEMMSLDPSIIKQLDELAKSQKVTRFVCLLTVYFVLLHRYSGACDLPIGTPFANRDRPELESLMGFVAQMVVIRANLYDNPSFTTLLQQINQLIVKAQKHIDVPFETLISELKPNRNRSYNPLFQVGFGLEDQDTLILELAGVESKIIEMKSKSAKLDLYLTIKKLENDFKCHLEYSTDLFHQETIQRMLNHYVSLLSSIVKNPEQGIGAVPILTESENRLILQKWNQTTRAYPKDQLIYRRFEEIVEQYPENQAISVSNQSISYRLLNAKANGLARHLLTHGVHKGECIGVVFDRSPEFIIALLAILKVGAVFVPMDSSYPEERRNFVLEDSSIRFVLTQKAYSDFFPTIKVVLLDGGDGIDIDLNNLDIEAEAVDLSHIFYTSGSTGKPKGVKLTHRGVLNLVSNMDWFPIAPNDRMLQITNTCFDPMILEVFGALLNGATLCIYPKKEISLSDIGSLLLTEKVTHAAIAPKILNMLLDNQISALKSLRYIVSGGEVMSVHYAKLASESLPHCKVINGYGPTETNVLITAYHIHSIKSSAVSIPIGKPFANTKVYLLNEYLQPVPIGVLGELYIGGDCVAQGYLNRLELTQERFISNPFGVGTLYQTGDICRFTQDGNLHFVSRKDNQIKLNGFRIELGEIEEVLRSHPQIIDSVVVTAQNRIVAYIVEERDQPSCLDTVKEYASLKLPSYMIPSIIMILDHIPLNHSGKVNVKALPAPSWTTAAQEKRDLETPLEKSIASIWSKILNVQDIYADDHFFKLGGSSIQAIQVVYQLQKELQINISMNFLFQYPILSKFAAQAINEGKKQTKISKCKATTVPISWNQESFWQIDLMIPNSSNYTISMGFQFEGNIHIPSLKMAANKILSRHEALRTYFEDMNGQRIQIIGNGEFDIFHFLDISHEPNAESKGLELLDKIIHTPFDLRKAPLIQVHLIKIGHDKYLGTVYVHHIIFDGWSAGVFMKEWRSFYSAYLHDKPIEELDSSIQHADFSCWQHEFFKTKEAEEQMVYWKKQIQGVQLLNLPWDYPRPERFKGNGDVFQWTLPEDLSADLIKTAKDLGVTLYELLMASYKVLLYSYSGQNDILVGSPFANRIREELQPLIGFFIHMFAIRTCLSGSSSFSAFVRQVSQTMAGAYKNSEIPCETIFAELYPNWNPTYNRFQVGFSLDTINAEEADFEGIKTTPIPLANSSSKFDFYLSIIVHQKMVSLYMYYCTDLFLKETVEKVLSRFQVLLSEIVKNPKEKIDQLL